MAKRQSWRPGDNFLIPLKDGTFAQGQVLIAAKRAMNSAVCGFTSNRYKETPFSLLVPSLQETIAILFVTRDLLDSGRWQINSNQANAWGADHIHFHELESNGFVGVNIIGSGIVENLLNAYHGLEPWNDFQDPKYLDGLLLSPKLKPSSVLLI